MKFSLIENKIYFVLIPIMLTLKMQAQVSSSSEIDEIQKNILITENNSEDFRNRIILQKSSIDKSRKINYLKGEITGYLNLAEMYQEINRPEECFYFLNKAEEKLKYFNSAELQAKLNLLYGTYYHGVQLHQQAIKKFNQSLNYVYKIDDENLQNKFRYSIYEGKRSSFESLNQMDSVYNNERKCMISPMLYVTIANRHLKKGYVDSAKYFIDKANKMSLAKDASNKDKSIVLQAYGKVYIKKGENKKALKYLFQSLELTKNKNFYKVDLETYKLLYEAYGNLDNLQKENEYMGKYTALNDSLILAEKKQSYLPLEELEKRLSDQNEQNKKNRYSFYYIIAAIIAISTITILILTKIFTKKEKEKNNIIDQKLNETDDLKKKLAVPIEDVVHLAIDDDPCFLIKFKELYSDFYNNLLSEFPHLTNNDMKFLALIKLKFSNKEIAEYAHISIRTVESKKYRLRKKIGLDPDVDFNKWVINR